MTLERLRIFVAVAEREHVTSAARALNLTQSAVSNAIAALEAEHGVRLFDRVGRGVALNEMGRAFVPEARAVLARAAAADAVLADMSALRRGRVTIFASQTIASYWLPRRLVAFHAAHPGVELQVEIGNTREAADAVLNGVAEIGLVEGDVDAPALVQTRIGSDRLAVIVAPDHPWADRRALAAKDLPSSPWVMREVGSGTRSTLEEAVREAGVDPAELPVAMTLPSNESVLAAAEAGAGATALSESVARAAIDAGRVVVAPFGLAERPYRLLRHAERYRSRAGEIFAQLITAPDGLDQA
ncbi:LysR family transcriptional regulator [Brevundimonas sp. Root1279]|uniref:LysR family transcriptional regulator n=1 Tax=Brevundimonas sp. Root1279 TaxID=1736443 RepID=UPI0006F421CF|nr:LysR family transcriptional regulator [Brevundimonas sp. Root1279]KQW79838.1 LysR family transcriptional regulator [Brevundimonas sp. Root1279]